MILVLGGTSETHGLCRYLKDSNESYILTVATDYGEKQFKEFKENLCAKRLNKEDMINLIALKNIRLIVDLTHPYAFEVSKNAIGAANETQTKYIRYERDESDTSSLDVQTTDTHEEAAEIAKSLGKRLFLSVGSNNADKYINYINDFEKIYLRILPKSNIIKKCEELGYENNSIIAMEGPFSKELNKEMLILAKADVMITKESGKAGGFTEKYEACKELNIPLIVVSRPKLDYPQKTNNMEDIKDLIRNIKR